MIPPANQQNQQNQQNQLITPYISIRHKLLYTAIITFWLGVPLIISDLHIHMSDNLIVNNTIFAIFAFDLVILAILLLLSSRWITRSHITYTLFDIIIIFGVYILMLVTVMYIYYIAHFYIAVAIFCLYCIYSITYTCTIGFVIYDLHLQKIHNRSQIPVRAVSETSISVNTETSAENTD